MQEAESTDLNKKMKRKRKGTELSSEETNATTGTESNSKEVGMHDAMEMQDKKREKHKSEDKESSSEETNSTIGREANFTEVRTDDAAEKHDKNREKHERKQKELISEETNAMIERESNSKEVGTDAAVEMHVKKKRRKKSDFEVNEEDSITLDGNESRKDEKKKKKNNNKNKETSAKEVTSFDGQDVREDKNHKKLKAHSVKDKGTAKHGIGEEPSSSKTGDKKNKKQKKEPLGEDVVDEGISTAGKVKKREMKPAKKISFSGEVEVFPLSYDSDNNSEKPLVQGKRFTPEEDKLVEEAVLKYIEANQLGEEGVAMILNCCKHRKVRGCWKEIGASLPWRPYLAVYYRAHILFERSEDRKWEPEEYEYLHRFYEKHGPDWRTLANALGKHRVHVKDAWRRVHLPNRRKGHWSQEEYQSLFDLVNLDLRMKAFGEKKTKHGMLRDNISWEAISEKLSTRDNAACCVKWYQQLSSPLVGEGLWVDSDDYRLMDALQKLDACCVEDVDWDTLLEHRSGEICRNRWDQMIRYIGVDREKNFIDQVEVLSKRYCPEMLEYKKD